MLCRHARNKLKDEQPLDVVQCMDSGTDEEVEGDGENGVAIEL